jgi:hypothetical protein
MHRTHRPLAVRLPTRLPISLMGSPMPARSNKQTPENRWLARWSLTLLAPDGVAVARSVTVHRASRWHSDLRCALLVARSVTIHRASRWHSVADATRSNKPTASVGSCPRYAAGCIQIVELVRVSSQCLLRSPQNDRARWCAVQNQPEPLRIRLP